MGVSYLMCNSKPVINDVISSITIYKLLCFHPDSNKLDKNIKVFSSTHLGWSITTSAKNFSCPSQAGENKPGKFSPLSETNEVFFRLLYLSLSSVLILSQESPGFGTLQSPTPPGPPNSFCCFGSCPRLTQLPGFAGQAVVAASPVFITACLSERECQPHWGSLTLGLPPESLDWLDIFKMEESDPRAEGKLLCLNSDRGSLSCPLCGALLELGIQFFHFVFSNPKQLFFVNFFF